MNSPEKKPWVYIYHNEDGERKLSINVPSRLWQLTVAGLGVGVFVGCMRGGRRAGLRFLAENAHRAPRTVEGWYFYKKTKNYRVLLAGLREGGREGMRYAGLAGIWAGVEVGLTELAQSDRGEGWQNIVLQSKSIMAGIVSGGTWSAIYRLPWKMSRRVLGYGFAMGLIVQSLTWVQQNLENRNTKNEAENAMTS